MNNSLDRLSDIWRAGSVVTVSRYDLILLANLDSVIDKYQTGVISTTCDSPTDAISNRTSVRRAFATTSDRCACSQLFCGFSSVVTVHIFSSVNKVVLTSLSEQFEQLFGWLGFAWKFASLSSASLRFLSTNISPGSVATHLRRVR